MATLQELQDALVNADKAGDASAARQLADAIHAMRSVGPAPTASERFTTGLADPIHGGAQLLTKVLPESVVKAGDRLNNWLADKTGLVARLPEGGVDQQVRQREADYKARRGDEGFDWMRMLGNVANPANLAIASRLPAAASLAGRVGLGASAGGATALANPVGEGDFIEEKAKQVAAGAVGGAAVPAVAAGLGRIISPKASTNEALKLLKAEGVRPTIGQTLGGMANRAEEKAISLPIIGDAIAGARKAAAKDLNDAVANRALAPINQSLPKGVAGRDAVEFVNKSLSDSYDNLLPSLTLKADKAFNAEVQSLSQMVKTGSIDPNAAKTFSRILQNDVMGKFKGQQALTGETFKAIESDLGRKAATLRSSSDADQRLVGDALSEVQSSLRDLLTRNNPTKADELKAINQGWAAFKRQQRASSYLGAEDGVFSPANLQSAVKALDRSRDKGKFARGDALMQDLSDAAKSVLGDKVPNSGTADRLMNIGAIGASVANPAVPVGLLGGYAAYSRPVQSLLSNMVSTRPAQAQQIASLLQKRAPMLVPAGGLLGLQVLD